jgi:hypothetical protein
MELASVNTSPSTYFVYFFPWCLLVRHSKIYSGNLLKRLVEIVSVIVFSSVGPQRLRLRKRSFLTLRQRHGTEVFKR